VCLLDALQQDASRSNQDLALALQISPATCLRRIRRLREAGLIERQMAVLSADRLAATLGHGLTAVVELTLDHQGDEQGRAKFHDAGERTVEREGRKRSDPTPASQRVTAAHKT
jgi:DNA-binding Lrp family transcriptional regulator